MNIVKLTLDKNFGNYCAKNASNIEMNILGNFLTDDASYDPSAFKEYALNDWEKYTSSNATALEKENGYILLMDLNAEEENSTILKMTRDQFMQILTNWEKILKLKPQEVIIKHEQDQFIVETKD
jgi:hypothetical protein